MYSSTGEVTAFTRHLLDGQSAFNSTTRPNSTELSRFLVRASGVLDVAIAGAGFTVPITNSTAKLACDDWTTARATEYVELTQRGVGYSGEEGSRVLSFRNMAKSAMEFIKENKLGFVYLGVPVAHSASSGLSFTGLDAHSERDDPSDSTLEQPLFTRRQFDNSLGKADDNEDDE